MAEDSQTLSATTLAPNATTTLTALITFSNSNSAIATGSYVDYSIRFTGSDGIRRYFHYKILINS